MRLADCADYRNCTIVDTGATDYICNDYAKFIKFDPKPTCAYIRTGAGPVKVNATSTIKIDILCADGKINNVTFSNVLYAPDMFVSIISHSWLRVKGLYYHGWDEKVYRKADGLEIAYTPDIDGIPNVLQASDSIQAARALAFAAAHTPHPNSALTQVRDVDLYELHETFGYADINALKQLTKVTTGLRLTGVQNFSCEVCMLGNLNKDISRCLPNRATTPFARIYVDIVGPVQPVGSNGERYWIAFTDDCTRYRWVYTADSKAKFTSVMG
jgi:hypothetical protein